MSRQCHSRDVYRILLRSAEYIMNRSNSQISLNFDTGIGRMLSIRRRLGSAAREHGERALKFQSMPLLTTLIFTFKMNRCSFDAWRDPRLCTFSLYSAVPL